MYGRVQYLHVIICYLHALNMLAKKFMSMLLVYDIRNPNVFYDMIVSDRELIPDLSCTAFV